MLVPVSGLPVVLYAVWVYAVLGPASVVAESHDSGVGSMVRVLGSRIRVLLIRVLNIKC